MKGPMLTIFPLLFFWCSGASLQWRDFPSQGLLIPRDCKRLAYKHIFQTNQSRAHTPQLPPLPNSHILHPFPNHSRTRYKIAQVIPYTLEPTGIIQTSQSEVCLPCLAHCCPETTTIKVFLPHFLLAFPLPPDQLWYITIGPYIALGFLLLKICE